MICLAIGLCNFYVFPFVFMNKLEEMEEEDYEGHYYGILALEVVDPEKLDVSIVKFKDTRRNVADDFYCAICYKDFEPEDEVMELKCFEDHIFHTNCIIEWFKRDPSCPICRSDVPTIN